MLYNLLFQLPSKPFENEAKFTAWLGRMIHDKGGLWHKISDMGIDSKPGDAIVAINECVGLVEIKVGAEKGRVDIHTKLRPCQIFGLKRYQDNGGTSIVIYYNKFHNKYRVMEYNTSLSFRIVDGGNGSLLLKP